MRKFFILTVVLLAVTACNNRPKGVLPKKDFTNLLVDVHIADGYLVEKAMLDKDLKNDSASYYNSVFKKYNINRQDFDENIAYYSENMVEFEEIYTEVIKKLEEKEKQIDSLKKIATEMPEENLWEFKYMWSLPEDGITNAVPFSFQLTEQGIYELTSEIRVFNDDKTKNLRITLNVEYADGTKQSQSTPVNPTNETWNYYKVSIKTDKNKPIKRIFGWLLDHSDGTNSKHIKARDIKLIHIPYATEK